MFNQEQYDILKRCSEQKDIAEWNNYRAEHPETKINLQNAELRKASLEGAILNEANLEWARLEEANLFAADLRKTNLRKANLERTNLWGANLSEANLEEASLTLANLENADLRRANLERVNLQGANLEGTILREGAEECLSDLKEEAEVIINLVDDITYEEFIHLIKGMERLSVVVGGSLPHLNEIQISHPIEENATHAETEMGNMVSINIPKNVADNLHGILHIGITAGQGRTDVTKTETRTDKKDSGASDGILYVLENAGFSEDEQAAVSANFMLQEDKLTKDLEVVTNLLQCSRIYFEI
jgi:hypothetical protein